MAFKFNWIIYREFLKLFLIGSCGGFTGVFPGIFQSQNSKFAWETLIKNPFSRKKDSIECFNYNLIFLALYLITICPIFPHYFLKDFS
jgi:hypothetical protein